MTEDETIKIIEDACWWYHKKGCSGLTQAEIFEARDRAMQALNSLEEVYANGYNDGFTQAEVNYENDKALSQEPTATSTDEPMTIIYPTIVCDDAISRDFLFRVLDNFCGHDRTATITLDTLADIVYELPSVTQKSETVTEFADRCRECGAKYGKLKSQKSGHWICIDDYHNIGKFKCSVCKTEVFPNTVMNKPTWNYCPNCGAKMESEEQDG